MALTMSGWPALFYAPGPLSPVLQEPHWKSIATGAAAALAFVVRPNSMLALVPLACQTLMVVGPTRTRFLLAAAGGGVLVLLGALLLDRWFYGYWVCTWWQFFKVNLWHGVASHYGTGPWWYYLLVRFWYHNWKLVVFFLIFFFAHINFRAYPH